MATQKNSTKKEVTFIDLFCGIGGFHYAIKNASEQKGLRAKCVFASDIDEPCRVAYQSNLGLKPEGDITKVAANAIPDHDILLAGFPCQPFSIIGRMKGFEDTRGTLFFDIARVIEAKQPQAVILENVKLLRGHNKGETLRVILTTLTQLGYKPDYKVLNALDFGLPQKRERIWITAMRGDHVMNWPVGNIPMKPLSQILEKEVPRKHFASEYIRKKRHSIMKPQKEPTIWHENKAGNISAYPYSCALRAGASYNYLLVDGERRLTPREMLRLQGFPDSFKIVCGDSQTRKQAGNSLPVNVAEAVCLQLLDALEWGADTNERTNRHPAVQLQVIEEKSKYNEKPKVKNGSKIPAAISA